MSLADQYFYFSRTSAPPRFGKFLVSGVIEARDEDAAIAQLEAALKAARSREDAQNFHFQALADVSRDDLYRILVTTMGEED